VEYSAQREVGTGTIFVIPPHQLICILAAVGAFGLAVFAGSERMADPPMNEDNVRHVHDELRGKIDHSR
jgi:hypothetical protein